MAGVKHFQLLLWKNFVIQKRHPVATVVQLIVPVILAVVLVLIRQEADTITYSPPQRYEEVPIETCALQFPDGAIIPGRRGGGASNPVDRKVRVSYAPNNPTVDSIMKVLVQRITYPKIEVLGFADEAALLEFAQFDSNKTLDVVSVVFVGVRTIEDLKSGDISYKIRFPIKPKASIFSPKDDWFTQFSYPAVQQPGPRNSYDRMGGAPFYCAKGFLSVQHNIAMAIGTVVSGSAIKNEATVSIQRFPFPAYYNDMFLMAIRQFLPLIIMLSFLYPAFDLVKNLVLEKERKLKESMKIMGLHGFLHWSSWFAKSMIFFTISTIFIVFFLCYGFGNAAVLLKSDWSCVFVFLMLYVLAGISFCCMLSTLFSKANSAATAGGIIWFLIYFPYFYLEKHYETMTYCQKMLSCLLCNTGMAFGSMQISLSEGAGFGVQWSQIATPSTPDDTFSMADVFVMLTVDSIIYLLITWYIDAVFPGEYGMPLVWYFPFQKHYWFKSKDKISYDLPPNAENSSDVFEEEPKNLKAGVQIQGLTKVFDKNKIAVNNLNLNMYENQITVLLGHNGAGKTTTMSMLTGLFPPTTGQALINGYEIHRDMESVRNSLGLCPQFNVLFDDLTVEEHLYFACKLKSCPANQMKAEINDMLVATNLVDKRKNLSTTLSGGMKRRLCVGMAFVGGSKVVMLDEPTSGMDPAARRFTWELLQAQGKGRTILLTTHFMDEADILGDRIAIMAHGQLQCCGSSMFLKKKFGAGYHMIMVKEPGCDVATIKALVKGIIPKAELESNVGAELSFILPHSSSSNFPKLFGQIEERKQQLKISSYGASVTTLEEVFLRVGEQSDATLKKRLQGENGVSELDSKYQPLNDDSPPLASRKSKKDSTALSIEPRHMRYRNQGFKLLLQQFWAMFVKRILHSRRNWILILVQLVIPILITVIILLVVNMVPSASKSPPLTLNLLPFEWTTVTYASEASSGQSLASTYAAQFSGTNKAIQASNRDVNMDNYLLEVGNNNSYDYSMHYIVGGAFAEKGGRVSAVAWFNNQPYHGPAISLAALDTALLRNYTGIHNLKLIVINEPLPETLQDETDDILKDAVIGFQIAFNIMFGMSFLVSSFIVFLVKEKACDAKHLQFVSGVNSFTFWISTFAWDFINFIIPCFGVMMVFVVFGQEGYNTLPIQGSMFLLFCTYGWCVLPFTYLASFMFNVASTAYARIIMFNIFSGVVTLITVSILTMLDSLHDTAVTLDWIFMALPNYCLAGAMKSLYDNYRGHKYCLGKYPALASFCDCDNWMCLQHTDCYITWKAPGIGRNLVFLFGWGVVYFLLILLLEVGLGRRFMSFLYSCKLKRQQRNTAQGQGKIDQRIAAAKFLRNEEFTEDCLPLLVDRLPAVNTMIVSLTDDEDVDVANERTRIHGDDFSQLLTNNTLIIKDLTKYYGLCHPFLAVNNLCVGVPRGECFGLLGINGAGKTSTFKMLTGDEMVSSGDAYVSGYSIRREMKMVRHRLGYCPQFDAIIDQMTGRETLVMFSRLRGVPEQEIPALVQTLSTNLLFAEHIDKMVKNYSGGNKRKLSTAVALVGDPPIVFLDEPTTGMDPMARRFVWDTISKVRDAGSSIILTSHSMEECDALCTRLAIMVNGRFQCLGSAQHLKNKFGKGYTLTAKILHNEHTASKMEELTQNLQRFIAKTFPGSVLKDQHQGMVHYQIPGTAMTWASIFGALEKAKVQYHLEDYSIGQTTLEQVFLSFTRKQQDGVDSVDT